MTISCKDIYEFEKFEAFLFAQQFDENPEIKVSAKCMNMKFDYKPKFIEELNKWVYETK